MKNNWTLENIKVELKNGKCLFYNVRLYDTEVGRVNHNEAIEVLPYLKKLDENIMIYLDISNRDLRQLGLNSRPMVEPMPAFAEHKKRK
ncbi:hypothetical protein [Staphylococcus kloosii]|uniref:hypothetical protein n=1 Tax=Staphylococcus kloosii TaxID=29384 RepID=UPI001E5CDD24|nr:hypothetical protein [Staphylococcus kloosii]MCD8878613.1 hypothetical protein [Staphylococcus kloosii]